jgi:hypothetical protein
MRGGKKRTEVVKSKTMKQRQELHVFFPYNFPITFFIIKSSVTDLDPHQSKNMNPDPHQSQKQEPDPHRRQNSRTGEALGAMGLHKRGLFF